MASTSRSEGWWLAAILTVFFLAAFYCLRVFSVHLDEPSYTDPAASFVLGQGFTSGAWYAQTHEEFWAGNVPLHQFCLVVWLKIFGFSQSAVRSIALFYVTASIWLIWSALKRGNFLKTPMWRLGCVAFLLLCFGTAQMLVTGRPDALTLLLVSIGLWAMTLENSTIRRWLLATVGLLAPWAGLQLAAYLALVGILILLFWKRRFLPEVVALASGGILGTGTLLGLYFATGTLDAFRTSIGYHTAVRDTTQTSAMFAMTHRAGGFRDPSFLLLIGSVAVIILGCVINEKTRNRFSECFLCIAALIGIPGWVMAVGVFPIYYSWLVVLPVSILLFRLLECGMAGKGALWSLCLSLVVLGAAMGAPRVFGDSLIHRKDRVNERSENFVKSALRPTDIALINQQAYYPAKQSAFRVYYDHWYLKVITEREKAALTVAIVDRTSFAKISPQLGGVWQETGESLSLPDRNMVRSKWFRDYPLVELAVFRKAP